MKKAIENGFGRLDLKKDINIEAFYHPNGDIDFMEFGFYKLIFDTSLGFIESLVGEGLKCSVCGYPIQKRDEFGWDCGKCNVGNAISKAHYHRSQLANMTLEQIKKYVNRLCEEE